MPLGGRNGRLYGVDAFEIGQQGQAPTGPIDLGQGGREALRAALAQGGTAKATGAESYGRPVVTLNTPSGDAGRAMVASGYALPYPHYLASDPGRLADYVKAQDQAIAAERGAYAGSFQAPWDYRHHVQGPVMGKVPLSPDQQRSYLGTLLNPNASPADLSNWYAQQGRAATNLDNILPYQRRYQNPTPPAYFQQEDVEGKPVLPNNPSLPSRIMNAADEGLINLLGTPVDLTSAAMRAVGIPIPDKPFLGSRSIREGFQRIGAASEEGDTNFAPRSTPEAYAQSIANAAGQTVVPVGAGLGIGGRILAKGGTLAAQEAGTVASVLRKLAAETAARPGITLAGEAGGAVGAGVGGQAARDAFPGNRYADMAGQILGGGIGGLGGGMAAARGAGVPDALAHGAEVGADKIRGNAQQAAEQQAAGEAGPNATTRPIIKDGFAIEPNTGLKVPLKAEDGAPFIEFGYDSGNDGAPYPRYGVAPPKAPTAPAAPRASRADMSAEVPPDASISAPVDRWSEFADHPVGASVAPADPWREFADHRPANIAGSMSPEEIAARVHGIEPGDVRPVPSNEVDGVDEAAGIEAGRYPPVPAPDERQQLTPYTLPGQARPRRNPLDLASWLRTQGGVADTGGDLAHLGINNSPRDMDFAKDEGFLGPLVNPNGMPVDEAARSAWEAGYFPDHYDRPTANDFIDALYETHRGGPGRVFHPSDYEAVDNYYSARDQRHVMEQAQQAGSPFHEDQGQPVSMADMDANSAPATAYEDLPKRGGVAGNIAIDRLETPGDINRVLSSVSRQFDSFDAARRGKMAQSETQALADEMGMTAGDLLRRRKGQALNAEQALAARQILAKSSDEIRRLAANAEGGTDADLAAFHQALIRHVAIQEQVSGATAEAGRALAQFKMNASSRGLPRIHKTILENAGGRDKLEEIARGIVDLERDGAAPGKVATFAQQAIKPKFSDKLIELYYNALLSNPKTHVVNTVSNALTAMAQIPEHALAAGFGALRGGPDRVSPQEVAERAIGMMQGAREGVDAFKRVARTGAVLDPISKVEARTHHAIDGVKGSIIRTPTRMLEAEDELFKSIGRRMELNGLAVRQARAEGLTGDAFKGRVQDLSANPTDAMIERSMDYARYITFQRPLGEAGQALSNLTQKAPALKLIVPFIRTPTNMVKYAVERSPLAPVSSHWRADVLAGGARRDLALAKAALGTGLGMTIAQYVADGRITGGQPADKAQADLLKAEGWQPYSVRLGDKYISYSRLDPFSTTISSAADIATAMHNGEAGDPQKAADQLVSSLVDQMDSKTFLSGLSDFLHAFDPRGNGSITKRAEGYAGRTAGSFIPAVVAQGAREVDPYSREQKGFLPPIENRVPFLSRVLPARQDAWGRDVVNQGSIGPDVISPFAMSARKNDPVNNRLLELGVGMSPPSHFVAGLPLRDDQYRQYNQQSGDLIYRSLAPVVTDRTWLSQPPALQAKQIKELKSEARKSVRLGLFGVQH